MSNSSTPIVLVDRAPALARYPHGRVVGDTVYVSGVSSRRLDNTHAGVSVDAAGTTVLDIKAQTQAVLENIRAILAAAQADLSHVVDITVFLVDMNDYAGMNEVYNTFFNQTDGPARTTVGVRQLPHPNLLVEMKAIAVRPAS